MKHQADVNVKIPTQDVKELIDHATDATLKIIAAITVAHILTSVFRSGRAT